MSRERKRNRLEGFAYSRPGAYFVTVCTKNRKCLLGNIVGGDAHIAPRIALSPMGMIAQKYLQTIPGIETYAIMPNHIHMILRISARDMLNGPVWEDAPTDANISDLIRSWKILTTKEIGSSIWQRSFFDRVIRNEREYTTIAQYILDNPAKWIDDDYYSKA